MIQDPEGELLATLPLQEQEEEFRECFQKNIARYCRWGSFFLFSKLQRFNITLLFLNLNDPLCNEYLQKIEILNAKENQSTIIPLIHANGCSNLNTFSIKQPFIVIDGNSLKYSETRLGALILLQKTLVLQKFAEHIRSHCDIKIIKNSKNPTDFEDMLQLDLLGFKILLKITNGIFCKRQAELLENWLPDISIRGDFLEIITSLIEIITESLLGIRDQVCKIISSTIINSFSAIDMLIV